MRRDARVDGSWRTGIFVRNLIEHVEWRPGERQPATKQLVEDGTKTVLIAGGQDDAIDTACQLGCDVCRRTVPHVHLTRELTGIGPAGNAEIHEVNLPRLIEQNVQWLDVPVNDALAMSMGQRLGHIRDDLHSPANLDSAGFTLEPIRQALAFHETHDDEDAIGVLADLEDRNDPRMLEARSARASLRNRSFVRSCRSNEGLGTFSATGRSSMGS